MFMSVRQRLCHNVLNSAAESQTEIQMEIHNINKRSKMVGKNNNNNNNNNNGNRRSSSRISSSSRREAIAWAVVCFQFFYILVSHNKSPSPMSGSVRGGGGGGGIDAPITTATDPKLLIMNDHSSDHYDRSRKVVDNNGDGAPKPYFDTPTIHPESAGLVSRVWHSNGSPALHPDNKDGSCWCGADKWCMCTASLAVDCILTSGPEHFLLVQRKDTGQYATMGGFVEVGETSAETVVRELKEEMNIDIRLDELSLFGMYSDPVRDARRHTASVAYVVDIPEEVVGRAGDDAAKVARVHISKINDLDFFADHKTILKDFIAQREGSTTLSVGNDGDRPVKRDVCAMK